MTYKKRPFFFFYIMYFLLYNLKSVFAVEPRNTLFLNVFLVCLFG